MNSSDCIGCHCVDEDNRELPENADVMTNESQLDASSFYQSLHRDVALDHSPMSDRSMPTLFNLEPSPNSINYPPMPPVCNNSLSSAGSDFIEYASPQNLHIFVRTLHVTYMSIELQKLSTINHSKDVINSRTGIPPHLQRFMSGYREYACDSRLLDLCVGETVTLLLGRILGGNPESNPRIMPMTWWLGFGCSYQDGHYGDEGKTRNVLSQFTFAHQKPLYWYSDSPLSEWDGVSMISFDGGETEEICVLDLYCRELTSVPDSIGNLMSLIHLKLWLNELTVLPMSIGNLSWLTDLKLSANKLKWLPESIENLTYLTVLEVDKNQLTVIPEWIGNFVYLRHLNLGSNQLNELPESIANLLALTNLNVSDNPITSTETGKSEVMRRFNRTGLEIKLDLS